MSIRSAALSMVCAAALAACAATGVKVTEGQLAALKRGQTSIEEVVAAFGPPTMRLRQADGSVILQYVYAEAKVRAATFVPIVGMLAGGSDVRSTTATLRFDAAGRFLDVTSSESQYGTGVGAAAGSVSPGQTQQPRQ